MKPISIEKIKIREMFGKKTCPMWGYLVDIYKTWSVDLISGYSPCHYIIQTKIVGKKPIFYIVSIDSRNYEEPKIFKSEKALKKFLLNHKEKIDVYTYANNDDCFLFVSRDYLFVNSFISDIGKSARIKLYESLSGDVKSK